MPTYEIASGIQFHGPARIEEEVNRRLPNPIRWSRRTRSLVSDGIAPEDLSTMTGQDIDWIGLDQRLGEESSLTVAAAILIEELVEEDGDTVESGTITRVETTTPTAPDPTARTQREYTAVARRIGGEWVWTVETRITRHGIGGEILSETIEEDTAEDWVGIPTRETLNIELAGVIAEMVEREGAIQ